MRLLPGILFFIVLLSRDVQSDTTADEIRVIDGPTLRAFSPFFHSCEATLHSAEAHRYNHTRHSRFHLAFLWNTLEVKVEELAESCPLDVYFSEPDVNDSMPRAAARQQAGKSSGFTLSPYGEPVTVIIQCKKAAFGSLQVPRSGAWYRLSIRNEFSVVKPLLVVAGMVLLLAAPTLSRSVKAFYFGGVALSFLLLSLVILFQMSKRVPGGSKAGGVFLGLYWVMPTEWRQASLLHYLSSLLWPFQQIHAFFLHGPTSADDYIALYAALGLLLLSAMIGFFSVRRWVINKETGSVEKSVAEFVLWILRLAALLMLFNGASGDHQLRLTITGMVAGVLLPPGSWIVAGVIRLLVFLVRVIFFPARLAGYLVLWVPLRILGLFGRKSSSAANLSVSVHGRPQSTVEGQALFIPPEEPCTPMNERKGLNGGERRPDGSLYVDPNPSSPARPCVKFKPPVGSAANRLGRWMTKIEMKRQMEQTTEEQVASLMQKPRFSKWMTSNHSRMHAPERPEVDQADLDDQNWDNDDANDDEVVGVRFYR
mmetsp:Transcript_30890/g.42814  ORF Transcript_30890/g.42814 Transcript_30890/m.42814 type:complete len:539 (+) Transcript_30890:181-1797(+)|eukprot:CAMPEP_0196583540 /NCGR_PEP_ID=MMETSP1081-20130531/43892_1 /TAXON_ID=36882 /ORGANISM="Pyramimonas amylifera, Strain CCMP720" /LENGTH=538 /DNA_ID=CAMNT_0041904463 /DNA_START=178 /DNA_END=1794 /DNA_ORIENTATION=-